MSESGGLGVVLWLCLASLRLSWSSSQAGLSLPAVALTLSDKILRQDWEVMEHVGVQIVIQISPKCSSLK